MQVLVTGGAGRVGRRLASRLLDDGHQVRAAVLPDDPGAAWLRERGCEVVEADLRRADDVARAADGVEAIAHLASLMLWENSAEADEQLLDANVRSTHHLLEAAARGTGVSRFFLASSDEVYPSLEAGGEPIGEGRPLQPYSYYGLTKELSERMALFFHRAHGVPVTIARFSLIAEPPEILSADGWSGRLVFAGGLRGILGAMGRTEAVAQLDRLVADGGDAVVAARAEDGTPYRFHFCDVRDLVDGITLMLTEPGAVGRVLNLAGPEAFSYAEAATLLAEHAGVRKVAATLPGAPIQIEIDISAAREAVGYAPSRTLERIVRDAVAA